MKSSLPISFHTEDVSFKMADAKPVIDIFNKILVDHQKECEMITVIFCSDEYLLQLNKKFLDHDYYTDILTFPLSTSPIAADIFISIDRVRENAETNNVSFENELYRVMIHGVLHLVGYRDEKDHEKTVMREKENEYLSKISS